MSRTRIWLIVILILLAGFISIGLFNPSDVVTSEFKVNKSASTTFNVLSAPANLSYFVNGPASVETIVEHQDRQGNAYRIQTTKGDETVFIDAEVVEFDDLEQFTYQFTRPDVQTRTTYSVFPEVGGARVSVRHEIMPVGWWRRSWLPLVLGGEIEEQAAVNRALADLVSVSQESLIGDWIALNPQGTEQMFSFRSDGTVDWKVTAGDNVYPLTNLHYERESSLSPELLDLSGFTSGPLRGLTLFGILDMTHPDTLVFDAEAGLTDDDRVRPTDFTSSTVTYVRIR
jgi:hypothetical protein